MTILEWIQRWYASYCDGYWEHDTRITISTLDNPGWSIFINLEDTQLVSVPFAPMEIERSEQDWIHCRVREGRFEGFGGAFNLTDILEVFQKWVLLHETENASLTSSGKNQSK